MSAITLNPQSYFDTECDYSSEVECVQVSTGTQATTKAQKKPYLPPPNPHEQAPNVFHLFAMMMKMSIQTESESYHYYRLEVKHADAEAQALMQQAIDKRREASKKEEEANRWGVLAKVANWIASIVSIVVGAALCATGVGIAAGVLMISGGSLAVGNQVMDLSGGWEKVKDALPGDDEAKKAAACTWIQIGVGIVCLVISAAGIIVGGGMDVFSSSFQSIIYGISGASQGAQGMSSIGIGIAKNNFSNFIADAKEAEMKLSLATFHREDALESLETQLEHLVDNYKQLAQSMNLQDQIYRAEQSIYH